MDKVKMFQKQLMTKMRPNLSLLPLKIALFCYQGGSMLFSTYLPLQGLEIGVTLEQLTIIFSILPIVSMVGPSIAGYLCDKLGCVKLILSGAIFFSALLHTLILYVDARATPIVQWPITISVDCPDTISHFFVNHSHVISNDSLSAGAAACNQSWPIKSLNLTWLPAGSNSWHVTEKQTVNRSTSLCDKIKDCPSEIRPLLMEMLDEKQLTEGDVNQWGLGCYIVLLLIGRLNFNAAFALLDSCSIYLANTYNEGIGSQKIFSTLAQAIAPIVSAALITWTKNNKGPRTYELTFYASNILFSYTLLAIYHMDVKIERKKDTTWRQNASAIIRHCDIDAFLVIVVLISLSNYYIDTFFYVYLADLGASDYLMSLTNVITNSLSIPLLMVGDSMVSKLGYALALSLSLLLYGVRMIAYSVIRDPWMCLPLEILRAISLQLTTVATSTFCASAVPTNLLLTLNGLNHACNFAIGRGLGGFLSGYFAKHLGRPFGFQLMSGVCTLSALTYYLAYRLYFRKREALRESDQKMQST